MGAESFVVTVECRESKDEARSLLIEYFEAYAVVHYFDGQTFLQIRSNDYGFEIEVDSRDYGSKLFFTMSLCHPPSAIDEFISLLENISKKMSINLLAILEEPPDGLVYDFPPAEMGEFSISLRTAYLGANRLWRIEFGEEVAPITCKEAIRIYVMKESASELEL
jgi:hypothetical protein